MNTEEYIAVGCIAAACFVLGWGILTLAYAIMGVS